MISCSFNEDKAHFNDSNSDRYNYWEWNSELLHFTSRAATEPTKFEIIKTMLEQGTEVSDDLASTIKYCAETGQHNVKIDVDFEKPLYDEVNKIIVWHVWIVFEIKTTELGANYICGIDFFIRDDTREAIIETFRRHGIC